MEIPYESLTEYVVNALVHRSLNIKAPIRIFIFDNRVEIHSPGALPNGLTVEDVKNGTSMPRNMFLFTNANYLLPYTGAGSGVRRALEYSPNAVFSNGSSDSREITHAANEFIITIPRTGNQAQAERYQVSSETDQATDQVIPKSDQVRPTKLTKKQQDICNYCSIPRTAKEILERVGVTSHFDNRKKYIYDLVEIGILERTIPDKPNDPNQKYRRKI